MTVSEHMKVGFAAAVGGIAPNVLYIALCLTGQQRKDPGVNGGYVVGLLLLASLGYLVAWLWNERVPQRAFYLGVGLPAMLQIAMSNPTQQAAPKTTDLSRPSLVRTLASIISPVAYAQSTPSADNPPIQVVSSPQRARTVKINFHNVPIDAQLVFMNANGQVLDQIRPDWARNAEVGSVLVSVPESATELEVVSAFARNAPDERLHMNPKTRLFQPFKLEAKSDFLSGFLRALGRPAADAMKLTPTKQENE
jgi:hypothetical protein